MKNLTPEGVYRTMRSLRHSGIYIRLKDSPSTSNPGRRRTSPVQQQERNGVDFPFIFSASEQRGKYTEKAEDGSEDHEWLESPSLWSLPLSETDQDEEEVDGRGDNWEPPKADENLRNKKPEKRKINRSMTRPSKRRGDGSGRLCRC
ncbi:hypothetical protein INR49_008364 [Caranx melampygus]|nr:hypothetical protein INR49_008364 [Caranx melampygus]